MVDVAHKNLSGVDLHETKGIAAAAVNTVQIADGVGSGTWGKVTAAVTDGTFTSGLIPLARVTASASATIDFVHGASGVVLDNTYDGYQIHYHNVRPATDDTALWIRIGTGGGPTYATGGSDYKYGTWYIGTGSSNNIGSAGASAIVMNPTSAGAGMANDAYQNGHGWIIFNNPENTAIKQGFRFNHYYSNAGSDDPVSSIGSGLYVTTGAITAVRIMASSGNITSGVFDLYGLRKPT